MDSTARLLMNSTETICRLCEGSGHDTTGFGCTPAVGVSCVCIRCGGNGVVPISYFNPRNITEDEVSQINFERVRDGLPAAAIGGYPETTIRSPLDQ